MASVTTSYGKTPKYLVWADELRRQIKNQELAPGDQLPSFNEMKSRYGVSRPLVERMHSLLAEEGLIVREPGKGVFVARPVQRAKTGVIGCLSFGIAHMGERQTHRPYWFHLLEGISQGVHEAGFQLMVLRDFYRQEGWEKLDGLVTTGQSDPRGILPGLPCVSLLNPVAGIPSVLPDFYGGTRQATKHLLELGHKRIGCLMFTHDVTSQRKISAYLDALREGGVEPLMRWQRSLTEQNPEEFDFKESAEKIVRRWLREDWAELGLTALVVENDLAALGAVAAFREAGMRIPEDVSVVGFDGTEAATYSRPPLSTVEVPLEAIGRRGVQELMLAINDGHPAHQNVSDQILLPTRLLVRGSTAAPKARM